MDVQFIKRRVKRILVQPHKEWHIIDEEPTTPKELLLYYVFPFAAAAAIISLLSTWAGIYYGFVTALRMAIKHLLMPIISIVVAALVLNELAETFDSRKNLNQAYKLVVYSYTPALLVGLITSISWTLSFLGILGLYGVYLFWVGIPILMKTPENKRLVYIIVAVIIIIVVQLIVGTLFSLDGLI